MWNKRGSLIAAIATLVGLLTAGNALAIDFPEVEANELKSNATSAIGMAAGDTLSGTTTGTAATAGALTSRDFFRVKTAADALGIYKYQLTLTTGGTAGHSGAIMGTAQSGAASDTTTMQTSTTTPTRMNQWYGFGKQEELFYRVQGTTSTTAPYAATLTKSVVVPVNLGSFSPGSFTFSTVGQTTVDTEIFLYDSNFNLMRSNDDEVAPSTVFQSRMTEALAPGDYYFAVSNFNSGSNAALESAATERSVTGNRMDFADSLVRSTTTTNQDFDFTLNVDGVTTPFSAVGVAAFDIYWAKLTVTPEPGTLTLLGAAGLMALRRRRSN